MNHDRLSVADTLTLQVSELGGDSTIGGFVVLDGRTLLDGHGRVDLDLIRNYISARLHLTQRDRQRVQPVPLALGRPVWVDDAEFDITKHVTARTLAEPSRDALMQLASDLAAEPFDFARPPWRLTAVDGLPGDQVALVINAHHIMADGYSALEWLVTRTTPGADGTAPAEPEPWCPAPPPSSAQLLAGALAHQGQYARRMSARALRAARQPRRSLQRAREIGRNAKPLLGTGAPAYPLAINNRVGSHLGQTTVEFSVDDLTLLRRASDRTINSLIVSAVGGGMRRLLLARGALEPGSTATILCPISTRAEGDTTQNIQVSIAHPRVPLDEPDPVARLAAVDADMTLAKTDGSAADIAFVQELGDFMIPPLMRSTSKGLMAPKTSNTLVTNLVGPREPLWLMGSQVLEIHPLSGLLATWTFATAVVSYAGTLRLGIRYDRDALPDINVLTEGIVAEIDELRAIFL